MCEARQRLLGRIRVNRRQASEMARVERLQQVEGLRASHLSDDDAIRSMSQRCSNQIGDRDRRQRCLVSERDLRATRFEPEQIRFVEMNLRRFLDDDNPVAIGNVRRQRVQ
jgi:hypothetical protein